MLAKVIRNRGPRKNARRDFARRVRYSCAKACEVALCNLAGHWPDAALQMEVAARLRQRVRRPCYHVVLSWAREKTPATARSSRPRVARWLNWARADISMSSPCTATATTSMSISC